MFNFDVLTLNVEHHYMINVVAKTFGDKVIIQGPQACGTQQIWLRRAWRQKANLGQLEELVIWIRMNSSLIVEVDHKSRGFTLNSQRTSGRPFRFNHGQFMALLEERDRLRWTRQKLDEIIQHLRKEEQDRAAQEKKEREEKKRLAVPPLFEPKTASGYRYKEMKMVISKRGSLYVPNPYEMVGRVCGSTKTQSGKPCKRWCYGTCKGH